MRRKEIFAELNFLKIEQKIKYWKRKSKKLDCI